MEKVYFLLGILLGVSVMGIVMFFVLRRRGTKRDSNDQEQDPSSASLIKSEKVLTKTNEDSSNAIIMISKAYYLGISAFHSEDKKLLAEMELEIEEFNQRVRKLKANTFMVLQQLQQDGIETGHFYVQIVDYLREMAHSIKYVVRPLNEHLDNNHKPFAEEQNLELIQFSAQFSDFMNFALHIIKESHFEQIDELLPMRKAIFDQMRDYEKRQIRRIEKKETNCRNSVLYFGLMSETKQLLLQTVNLLKATRDFVSYTKSETNNVTQN